MEDLVASANLIVRRVLHVFKALHLRVQPQLFDPRESCLSQFLHTSDSTASMRVRSVGRRNLGFRATIAGAQPSEGSVSPAVWAKHIRVA
jgi:hypothetical protein